MSIQQQAKLSLKEKLAYGLGDVGNGFMYDLGQIYLLKFYTDTLGLPPVAAGGVFFFTKIFDAFTDFSVGTWVDKRKKIGRRGKFRPFMLFGTVPLGLATVASFYNPEFSVDGNLAWAYFTYMLFGLMYSIVNIPYGSMIPAMTQDPVERSQLSAIRQGGSTLALLITTVLFVPLTMMMPTTPHGALIVVSIFALVGVMLQLWCYANVREYVPQQSREHSPLKFYKAFKALWGNGPLLLLCLASLFTFSAFNVKLAVQVYYLQYVLEDLTLLPYMGFFSIGCVFFGVAIVPWLTKHYGKKNTFMLGCFIWSAGDLINYFFIHSNFGFILFSCVAFFGSALINSLSWAIASDAVEYGQWRSGYRTEGMVYSFFIFSRKISQSIAGLVPGLVLAFVGYVPHVEQTPEALTGIRMLMFVYPGALLLLTLVIWFYGYRLDEERYEQILIELNNRELTT